MITSICQRIYSACTRCLFGALITAVCLYVGMAIALYMVAPYAKEIEFPKGLSAETQDMLGHGLVASILLFSLLVAPLLQKTEHV